MICVSKACASPDERADMEFAPTEFCKYVYVMSDKGRLYAGRIVYISELSLHPTKLAFCI